MAGYFNMDSDCYMHACTYTHTQPIYSYTNKNRKEEVGHLLFPAQKTHSANWPGTYIPSTLSW